MRAAGAPFRAAAVAPILLLLLGTRLAAQPDEHSAPDLDWHTITTKHFFVHYHAGVERTARAAAIIAEEVYGPITALYGHEPDSRVSLIMKDISDYSNGAAYFFNNKIELWASPLDFELRGTHNWLRNVITHEFTHMVQIQSSMKYSRRIPALTFQVFGYEEDRREDVLYGYPNLLISYPLPGVIVPPWFAEGTAQYQRGALTYETWDAHRDMILRSYVLADSMLTWGDMSAFGKTSLGNESVYNAGYALTRYIARTYGEDTLAALTRALSKPFTFTMDGVIKDVLGKSGTDLYGEWAAALRADYSRRIAPVRAHRVEGEIIGGTGFGNFHPAFSPDGKTLAYVSNKTADYFGQSSLYLYAMEGGKEELLQGGVRSALSWTPDGKTIVYSKYNTPGTEGELYYDLYATDLATKEERRITRDLRAYNPSVSPDGRRIAFVSGRDGSVNLGVVDIDGGNPRQLTSFDGGQQVFTPRWTSDGAAIVFGYSPRDRRRVARVASDGSGFTVLAGDDGEDCRDPHPLPDGRILFSSDRAGIHNLYTLDAATGTRTQVTNVEGGAFMPAADARGNIAYAAYTAGGYKLALLRAGAPVVPAGADYLAEAHTAPPRASATAARFDWDALNGWKDSLSTAPAPLYERVFQSLMWFPTLRIDDYNPLNHGIQLLKPGVMVYGSDVLTRLEFAGGAFINTRGERDLFFTITYRDRLPLFSTLGLFPDLSFDVYNVTRESMADLEYPLGTVSTTVDYNLLDFAVRGGHNIINNRTHLEVGYRHSRYTSTVGSYNVPGTEQLVGATDYRYLLGNDLHLAVRYKHMLPTTDGEINPVGVRAALRWDYQFNQYNPEGQYTFDPQSGIWVPVYQQFNFNQADVTVFAAAPLPGWRHTLAVRARAATILGPPVDEYFNNYGGGITGMQGYTFYAIGGNELASLNVTYRFPIIPRIDWRVGHVLIDKLYGGLFFDAGDGVDALHDYALANVKKDVGFELRLETFSFSMYPTRIFFSGAYGLDQYTKQFRLNDVTYGHEWRWYFGMLFGFDLSDGFRPTGPR